MADSIEATFVGFHLCRVNSLRKDLGCLHKLGDGSCSFSQITGTKRKTSRVLECVSHMEHEGTSTLRETGIAYKDGSGLWFMGWPLVALRGLSSLYGT